MSVDDLVVDEKERSKGYGKLFLDWLIDYAKRAGCQEFRLDSGVHRKDAHRFYLDYGLLLSTYHFSKTL